ncbi:MAG TPA: helix-turn-helix domain-containing protein [Candidatus Marinimicrobia bacterium]|nr:helix-turn-helix domain-containing protein [Candidatus Neomarinimicrobiota bacterium]
MFYEELKKLRESKGISLEQISSKIKVNKSILDAFEKGDFSRLPETYIRLFLKTYASELGADPVSVLKEYEAYTGKNVPKKVQETEKEESNFLTAKDTPVTNGNKRRNIAAITIILVILIFVISVLKQVLMEEEKNKPSPVSTVTDKIPPPVDLVDTTNVEPETNIEEIAQEPESQLLSLVLMTKDTCWVRVITDEIDTTEANYLPNIRREWKAERQFDVRVGRPSKVELSLNNQPLGSIGKTGIPTRLIITKDGIVRSILLRR